MSMRRAPMENEKCGILVKKRFLWELKKNTGTCFMVDHKSIINIHFTETDLSNHSNDTLSRNIF